MLSSQLLSDITETIKNTVNPDRVILFGSHAYGAPSPESDIDLFIISEVEMIQVRETKLKLRKALRNIILTNNIEIDLWVDNNQRIKQRILMGDLFLKEITEKGITIYGK